MRRFIAPVVATMATLLALFGVMVTPARAACSAAITVANANDSGAGSLRAAIANVCTGGTITFSAAIANSTITLTTLDPSGNGALVVSKNLTIDGGSNHITISGGGSRRIFYVATGTVAVRSLTLTAGVADYGGAVWNGGTLTLTDVTLDANAATYGGAIHIEQAANLTVADSTFRANIGYETGGAINNNGTLTVTNSTFADNSADYGGAIFNWGVSMLANNVTFAGNSAGEGGAIYNASPATVTNSVFAKGANGSNCLGTISGSNNLDDDGTCAGVPISHGPLLLGTLGTYGGPTQTIPLLPGSAAIDGATANCPATDQRGVARSSTCDIGAFESRGYTLTRTGGDGQSTTVGTAFALPLRATLTETGGSPLPGASIAYGVPSYGPSATLSSATATTNASGVASMTATANALPGMYVVTATAPGAVDVPFTLTNLDAPQAGGPFMVTVSADHDDGLCGTRDCTLREAIDAALATSGEDAIRFLGTVAGITLTSALPDITASGGALTIDGGGMVAISGANQYRIFFVNGSASLTLQGLTLTAGKATGVGGAISNLGTLTVSDTTFDSNASDYYGGAIYSSGPLTVANSTFTANTAPTYAGAIHCDSGTLTITNSVFSGNWTAGSGGALLNGSLCSATVTDTSFVLDSADYGGAIDNFGALTASNSTFDRNSADSAGGAVSSHGALTMSNDTFDHNSAGSDGGAIVSDGTMTVTNGTFNENAAPSGGAIWDAGGTTTVRNSVLLTGSSGSNCAGTILTVAGSPNRADDGTCGTLADSRSGIALGSLGSFGGATQTVPLLPGSVAIDAATANCPATDQRGIARGTTCDIGAFESGGFTLTKVSGDGQSAVVNTAFVGFLVVGVTANAPSEPIDGGTVIFTGSGISPVVATIGGGLASREVVANATPGAHTVTASAAGATSVFFALTNLAAEPATQATGVTFDGFEPGAMTVHWTKGSGTNSLVLLRAGGAVDSGPVDGTSYTASASAPFGTQVGSGNFVAYAGTGTSVALTGLATDTYHVAVYTFDGAAGAQNYRTAGPATGSHAADATPPHVTIFTASTTAGRTITVAVGGTDVGSGITAYAVVEGSSAPTAGAAAWTAWPAGTPPFDVSFTVAAGDGDHTVSAFTRDAVGGLSAAATAHVVLDTTAPVAFLGAPDSSAARTITVSMVGTDAGGTGVVAYALVEGTAAPAAGSAAWVTSAPTSFRLSAGDGVKTISAFVRDGVGNVSAATTRSVTLTVSTPIAVLAVPALVASASVPLDWTGSAGGGSLAITGWFVAGSAATPDPADAGWQGSAPSTFTVTGPDGPLTLHAWVRNADGAVSARATATTTLDRTPPTAPGTPTVAVAKGVAIGATIPVTLAWTATTDATSGPVAYALESSSDGGTTWTDRPLADASATGASLSLASGSWAFRVRATDRAGNTGTWATARAVSLSLVQENGKGVKAAGGFKRIKLTGASGGYVSAAKKKNAAVTFSATGTSFFLVSDRGRARGIATIYVDGRKAKTIDLYARTTSTGTIVWSRTFAKAGKHTIKVVVTGQKNRKATSTQVDLDAFIVKG
jgi:CSLREA domain-containing protein